MAPGGSGGTYNNAQTGVWYAGSQEGMFNESGSSPPLNSACNLLIFPQLTQTAQTSAADP